MNQRIEKLIEQCQWETYGVNGELLESGFAAEKFAQLIVQECIGILETEIELVKGYKSTAHNDFDIRWHDGKIVHFTKLIEKSKQHFGVEE